MATCADCANYQPKTGECRIVGPVPADRDAARCPVRTFIPRDAGWGRQ
ncbi:MAG: hypothetical protein ACP5C4_04210 [Methanomicrobiales archaeon]